MTTDVLPPHSLEAEKCFLACLMLASCEESIQILGEVAEDRFFSADSKIIYAAAKHIFARGQRPDAPVLMAELKQRGVLEEIGGVSELVKMFSMVPSVEHWKSYADIVNDRALRRDLIRLAEETYRAAYAPSVDFIAQEIMVESIKKLGTIQNKTAKTTPQTIGDIAMEIMDMMERKESPLIKTGIDSIDRAISGMAGGETWLVAARPSMGKSTLARQMAYAMAHDIPVAYFSLEESRHKVARNMLAMIGGIENGYLRSGLNPTDTVTWSAVTESIGRLQNLPLYVVDRAAGFNGAFSSIRSTAAMLVHRYKCKAMFVDYLALVQGFRGSPYERVTEISMAMTGLAKELGVPLILLAQLNRANVGREDKRPGLSDLRDSGQIEQDADGVIFIHREDYYHLEDGAYSPDHIAEFIVAKCRDGARGGVVKMRSNLKYQRFEEFVP